MMSGTGGASGALCATPVAHSAAPGCLIPLLARGRAHGWSFEGWRGRESKGGALRRNNAGSSRRRGRREDEPVTFGTDNSAVFSLRGGWVGAWVVFWAGPERRPSSLAWAA